MTTQGNRVAILGVVAPQTTLRATERVLKSAPGSRPIVLVPELDIAHFESDRFEVWPTGEEFLELHAGSLTKRLVESGVSEVVIPLGLPRRQLLFVADWVRKARGLTFRIAGRRIRLGWRPAVVASLVILALLVRVPVSLVLRLGRVIDGLVLIALAVRARRFLRHAATARDGVVHVITHLGTGGAQQQLLQYLQYAARANVPSGLEVVALFARNRAFESRMRATGVPVTILEDQVRKTGWGRAASAAFPYSSVLLALTNVLRKHRPHTVFSWLFLANAIAATAARSSGVPRVVTSVRNLSAWKTWPEYRHWWYRPIDRLTAAMSDVIVANANAVARDFEEWSGCGLNLMRVLPNAVDADRLLELDWTDLRGQLTGGIDREIVLTVGRLSREKRHVVLLEMVARLRRRRIDPLLVIAGHGQLEGMLRQRAGELGVGDNVRFLGKSLEPQSLYRAADVFVLASLIEGMPNVLLEAQAFGLPVVTTDAGGAGEVVQHEVTGVVVPVDDVQALTDAVGALLGDPERRRRMGTAAQHRVRERFAISDLASSIDDLTFRNRLQ